MVNRWSQGAPYGTTAIPYIGENGNWWVNQEDTGVKAQGPQGQQGQRGEAGIGAPGPALMYEDMTEEQKLELASHYTADMQAIKDSCIADTNALIATAKTEMDATKAAALKEAATIAEETTAGIVNAAVENAQADIDASVATATTNINAAAANAENSKVAAQEAANSATATLESMQNIKQEAITAAQNAAAETATSTVNTLVEQAQANIDANITEAKNAATAAATNADASKVEANASANSAASSATSAANSATEANAAKVAAEAAANSVTLDADAMSAAVQASKSYAVGGTGTREGEDTDNSKHYYGLCKTLAESNGSSYMGECAYADLPADAPVGAVYKITVDENGEPVYLLTEAELTEINNAIDAAYKNNNVQLMITASARAIEKTYDNQSLFIKTSSGWEPYVQNVTHVLMDTLFVAFSMVAGSSGPTTELVDTITNLKKQMGYSYYPSFDEIPYDNVLLPYCAGVNTTGDTYTVIQEANSSSVVVKGAMKTDAFDCVLTEALSLPSGDYTAVLTCASFLNNYYTAFTVSIIDTADGSVKAKWDKNDITNSLTDGNAFVRFMTSSDTVAKVMLHIEGMSNAQTDAYLTLGVFNAQLYSMNFADVIKTIQRAQYSTLNAIHATACKTLEEVNAVTKSGSLVDAMAVKELDGKIAYGNEAISEVKQTTGYTASPNLLLPLDCGTGLITNSPYGTVNADEDGVITVTTSDGATSSVNMSIAAKTITLSAGTYTVSCDYLEGNTLTDHSSFSVQLDVYKDSATYANIITRLTNGGAATFTLTESTTIVVTLIVATSLTIKTRVVKPVLVAGTAVHLPICSKLDKLQELVIVKKSASTVNYAASEYNTGIAFNLLMEKGYTLVDYRTNVSSPFVTTSTVVTPSEANATTNKYEIKVTSRNNNNGPLNAVTVEVVGIFVRDGFVGNGITV